MKKVALGVSMVLACLVFLVPPATAASVSHGAPPLSAFLASLAGPVPVSAAKHPAIVGKSLCTATANCGDGTMVSCSSNTSTSSCSAADHNCPEVGHVTCDGVTTWCSNPCPCTCSYLASLCAQDCYPCAVSSFSCLDPASCDYSCHCSLRNCF
jgi:hypothetical protein